MDTYDRDHTPLRPSRPRAGMREVAARAGVAMSSVSRVLSDHPDVSDRMRERVLAAVDELGYRPDLLAQGLRGQRTMTIGFTVADISNPVLADLVTGAEHHLRTAGYSLLLTSSEGDATLDAAHIRVFQQRRIDGLLASLADERSADTADALRNIDVPVVLIDRDQVSGVAALRVLFDHQRGMRAAAEELVSLGHRELAFIDGGPRRPARERREGIEDAIARSGFRTRCRTYSGDFSIEHGEHATHEILERAPEITAIIAGGNLIMHGALRALRARAVHVGDDMSFVGCDDVAVAEFHEPPIAIVRRDTRGIGVRAAELVIGALDGLAPAEDVVLPTEFVGGPSCAPPREEPLALA
jgi:LacI family transcriptional regulator